MTSPQVPPEPPRHSTAHVHKARSILTGLVGRVSTRILVHWVDGCRRFAPFIVVAALALTAGCGYYAATNLGIQTNSDALLSHDLPYR